MIWDFIASVIIYNSYTPDMHKKCSTLLTSFVNYTINPISWVYMTTGIWNTIWNMVMRFATIISLYLEHFDYRIRTSSDVSSLYISQIAEKALKEVFGLGRVFDAVKLRLSGMKYAVTATIISDAILYLILNYNSNSPPGRDSRYKYLRAKKKTDKVLLWEAARCIIAALTTLRLKLIGPSFFTLKYLEPFAGKITGIALTRKKRNGTSGLTCPWSVKNLVLTISIKCNISAIRSTITWAIWRVLLGRSKPRPSSLSLTGLWCSRVGSIYAKVRSYPGARIVVPLCSGSERATPSHNSYIRNIHLGS
ncbi:uncharacterized protein RAG0_07837 [Rhynchosporium agropyri]|uniref:Uncharacterized protein n=1 Tax=Rhynchosporium agropyri TaxID=914238 RepID=A0A1E1KNB3_9HELO|nr:uncharacterized protein RAG0_07837 [Rhynchosporium agropyri]